MIREMRRTQRRRWGFLLLAVIGPGLWLGGCSERVVEADGPYRGTVYEPNLEAEDDGVRELDER